MNALDTATNEELLAELRDILRRPVEIVPVEEEDDYGAAGAGRSS